MPVQRDGRPRGPKGSELSDCLERPIETMVQLWDEPQDEQERGPQEEWLEQLLVAHTSGQGL